jgi:hypothetical protein
LQLNAPAIPGMSYLSTGAAAASLGGMEWQFFIKLSFSPSDNNNARIYLVSDQSSLENPLNGYYLQFGENLANDAIELFRQTGTGSVSVARGTDGFIASPFTIRVRVTRDAAGTWSLYADPAAGSSFTLQATGSDLTWDNNSFFGVVCEYTSSNSANFYFDDFYFGPVMVDTLPPALAAITVQSSTSLDVQFSEPVDSLTASDPANYSADNGLGNPATAVPDANPAVVHLNFPSGFQSGLPYTLTITNVEDLNGNAIGSASASVRRGDQRSVFSIRQPAGPARRGIRGIV